MKFSERFRRWRASKGYGIHSPLGFRIVKRVVRPDRSYWYYGEERLALAATYRTSPELLRRSRLLLRLTAEIQPAYVWTSPGLPEIYLEAIRLAGGVVRIYDGTIFPADFSKADMVVAQGPQKAFSTKKTLKSILLPEKALIWFDLSPKVLPKVVESMTGGVVFDAVSTLIALPTKDTTTHLYHISRI